MFSRRPAAATLLASLVTVLSLFFSASAGAQITLGSLPATASGECIAGPFEGIQAGPAQAAYTVPQDGVITSWSTKAITEGSDQELSFKVYRRVGPKSFLVVAIDGPRVLTPGIVNSFSTQIPVKAGDLIGNNDIAANPGSPVACTFASADPTDETIFQEGNAGVGGSFEEEGAEPASRLNVIATLLPPPTITAISPGTGLPAGATTVTITGANFALVKSVTFGTASAPFVVNDEGRITATAPASAGPGAVPVSVTTAAGGATAPIAFAYAAPTSIAPPPAVIGCVVPKLKGKKLSAAKRRIRAGHCRVGHVRKGRGVTAKTGEVTAQSPSPGTTRVGGSKVNVRLG